MKTRGSWVKVAKFVGVAVLVSSLFVLNVILGSEKRVYQAGAGLSSVLASGASGLSTTKDDRKRIEAYDKLPLSFEENLGQTAKKVRFVSHGTGYALFLTPQEVVLSLSNFTPLDLSPLHRMAYFRALREAAQAGRMTAIRMQLDGANPETQISGTDPLPTKVNYFVGNDPKKWHIEVPSFARVKYAGIYPGVDLVFYSKQRRLEYDFIVAPGADPKAIRFRLQGAHRMSINAQGDLVLNLAGGEVEFQKPVVYQVVKGKRQQIAGSYSITKAHEVSFTVPAYDRSEPLVLDPVLNYSTYLGGSASDTAQGIAVDSNGDAFIAGATMSTDFPGASGSLSAANAHGAVFVTEIDPTGTKQLYSTYLAGTGTTGSFGLGIALDPLGNIYVTGETFSTDFPTTSSNALKPGPNPGAINGTSFISKINPTLTGAAQLVYSSYLGGTTVTASDFGNSVAADANGNAYVTGFTGALPGSGLANFPITANAFQSTLGSANGNAFLSRIDTTKTGNASLIYSTYLGGSGTNAVSSGLFFGEEALGVVADSTNNAYLIGTTTSTDFPMTTSKNGFQVIAPAAIANGTVFVSRIDTTKTGNASLIYSTYLGGDKFDFGTAIALGPNNVAYTTGTTSSPVFPTLPAGAFQACVSAGTSGSAFISLVDTGQIGSNSVKYSTCLAGSTTGFGIQADAAGNAYVGGGTRSSTFPRTPGAFQPVFVAGAAGEGFLAKLNPGGNGSADLVYSTFFGGGGNPPQPDSVHAVALDSLKNVYLAGVTFSSAATFPVFPPGAIQTSLKGPSDAFVAKLTLIPTMATAPAPGTTLDFGTVQIGTTSAAQTITLTNNTNGPISFTGAVKSGPNAADYMVTTAGCTGGIVVGTPCVVSVTFTPTAPPATEVATLTITDGDSTSPQVYQLTGKGANPPPNFTLSAAPTALNVAQGAVGAPVTITVNPTNGFASAVALTCTGAPANSSCVLSPTSITPPTTSALTFTAHAMLVPLPISRPAPPPMNMWRIVPLFVALMILFLLRSTERLRTRLALVSAICLCVTIAACSGSGPAKTTPGTYPLTVTGTSGALSHNTTVTITVN